MKLYRYRKDTEPKQLVEFLGISDSEKDVNGDVLVCSHFRFNYRENHDPANVFHKGCEVSAFLDRASLYNMDWKTSGASLRTLSDNITKFYTENGKKLMNLCRDTVVDNNNSHSAYLFVQLKRCVEKGMLSTQKDMERFERNLMRDTFKNFDNVENTERTYRGWQLTKSISECMMETLNEYREVNKILNSKNFSMFIKNTVTVYEPSWDDPGDIDESFSISVCDSKNKNRILFTIDNSPVKERMMQAFNKKMETRMEKECWDLTNRDLSKRLIGVFKEFDKLIKKKNNTKTKSAKPLDNNLGR